MSSVIKPEDVFTSYAMDVLGSSNMAVDGSSTPAFFDLFVTDGPLYLEWMKLIIIDKGIRPLTFGGLPTLDNGIVLSLLDAEGKSSKSIVFRKNADFHSFFEVGIVESPGDDQLSALWSTRRSSGHSLYLSVGRKLRWTVQDDLRGITEMSSLGQGRTE